MCAQIIVVDRFRKATGAAHRALDATLDTVGRLRAVPTRIAMLRRYHTMHAGAEAAMSPFLGTDAELDFSRRCRVPALLAGLAELGAAPAAGAIGLPVGSRAAALGVLYVMEGSTLGGRMIRRDLAAAGCDLAGLQFLDPYGAETGAMWRGVLHRLDAELATDADALDTAVGAAIGAFAYAASCLADRAALVRAA